MSFHTSMQKFPDREGYYTVLVNFGADFLGLGAQTYGLISVESKYDSFFYFLLDEGGNILEVNSHDNDLVDGGGEIAQAHLREVLQLNA